MNLTVQEDTAPHFTPLKSLKKDKTEDNMRTCDLTRGKGSMFMTSLCSHLRRQVAERFGTENDPDWCCSLCRTVTNLRASKSPRPEKDCSWRTIFKGSRPLNVALDWIVKVGDSSASTFSDTPQWSRTSPCCLKCSPNTSTERSRWALKSCLVALSVVQVSLVTVRRMVVPGGRPLDRWRNIQWPMWKKMAMNYFIHDWPRQRKALQGASVFFFW